MLGCVEEELPEIPADLIAEEAFIPLYTDVHILEASLKQKLLKGHDSEVEVAAYYHHVFEKHGVSQELFEATRAWYATHPKRMQSMLEQAMENVATLQAERGVTSSEPEETPPPKKPFRDLPK